LRRRGVWGSASPPACVVATVMSPMGPMGTVMSPMPGARTGSCSTLDIRRSAWSTTGSGGVFPIGAATAAGARRVVIQITNGTHDVRRGAWSTTGSGRIFPVGARTPSRSRRIVVEILRDRQTSACDHHCCRQCRNRKNKPHGRGQPVGSTASYQLCCHRELPRFRGQLPRVRNATHPQLGPPGAALYLRGIYSHACSLTYVGNIPMSRLSHRERLI